MSPHRSPSSILTAELDRPLLTKIVATLGPATESPETIARLIDAGVSVFRFNFSHGHLDDHARHLQTVRGVADELGRPVACMGDLQGPKIRVGRVPGSGLELAAGQDVVFRAGLDEAREEPDAATGAQIAALPTTYPGFIDEVEPGQRVLINDGAIRMLAVERDPDRRELRCRVTVGGLVTSGKGINLPESDISVPAITERDWECVHWAVEHGLDLLALSFVRKAEEVVQLRERLAGLCPVDKSRADDGGGSRIQVVAKVEKPQAVLNIAEIVDAADAVMVARGDLGVEMDIARVPVVQKQIIAECAHWGKPSIVATQMLESMISSPTPTRAEASDVANARFDGADAVMLSGETAIGKHPVLVVETMRRILLACEARIRELPHEPSPPPELVRTRYQTAALAHGAWHIARDTGAVAVACWSQNGGTARYLSQNNFRLPILAYSSDARATRRMALLHGVFPIHADPPGSGLLSDWNQRVDTDVQERGLAGPGDPVVLLAGKPLGRAKATNTLTVSTVGDPASGFRSSDDR